MLSSTPQRHQDDVLHPQRHQDDVLHPQRHQDVLQAAIKFKLVQTIGTEVDHVTEVEGKASMQIIQHLPVDGFRPDEGKFSPVIYNTDCMGNSQWIVQ